MEQLQVGQRVAAMDRDGRLGVVEQVDGDQVVVKLASGELHRTEASRCLPTGLLGDWPATAEEIMALGRQASPPPKRAVDWMRAAQTALLWALNFAVLIFFGLCVLGSGPKG